ncbi:hypothetical protein [Pseudonocardia spinosispora]|uniref:hypothetical protein n=1 Tax=Pseudonocardia spinosispora TaxID=103441 RepID=UPI00146FA645|nr:hypothetical protein [Pseudonocardia spinosispora]
MESSDLSFARAVALGVTGSGLARIADRVSDARDGQWIVRVIEWGLHRINHGGGRRATE